VFHEDFQRDVIGDDNLATGQKASSKAFKVLERLAMGRSEYHNKNNTSSQLQKSTVYLAPVFVNHPLTPFSTQQQMSRIDPGMDHPHHPSCGSAMDSPQAEET